MFVIKRNGVKESMRFDKISDRLVELCRDLTIDPAFVTQKVVSGLRTNMTTAEIDEYVAETAFCMSTYDPDYDVLSGRLLVSNLHKQTIGSVLGTMRECALNHNAVGEACSLIDPNLLAFVEKHAHFIEATVKYERDYNYTYFAVKTMMYGYLLKRTDTGKLLERPQHLYMRCALGIHYPRPNEYALWGDDNALEADALRRIVETYDALSLSKFTHATPTLFNAGTNFPQLSSCNLLSMDDSVVGMYKTLEKCARISQFAGGLGISISGVRSRGAIIRSTNGKSDGIVPLIKGFDQMCKHINQGGKRNGSVAMYLEPWHPDVMDFLEIRLNDGGPEEVRMKRVFSAMWIPDLFMRRCDEDGLWSLIDPDAVRGLPDMYGEEFEKAYLAAEQNPKLVTRVVKARDVLRKICASQVNCGLPYVMFKDHVNRKSNHMNIGTIRGSNLCSEIVQRSDKDNVAVCILASISIKSFLKKVNGQMLIDYEELMAITRMITNNLNRTIDYGFTNVKQAEKTNREQRAIGIGIQGLHETLIELGIEWDSEEAKVLNGLIMEAIYYAGLEASADLAVKEGSYKYFEGSPYSKGIFQYDMWNVIPMSNTNYPPCPKLDVGGRMRLDWDVLRAKCMKGMRNSMITALMPTATTSQMMGNTEAFECASSNIYTRKVLAGEFPIVSKQLYRDLSALGLWNRDLVDRILANGGSIQHIDEIPVNIRRLYRTIWEYSQKVFIDLAIVRGAYVDQAQSLNIYMEKPTVASLSSMLMYGWKQGAKNGNYYVRSKPARNAVQFTVGTNQSGQPVKKTLKNGKPVECTDDVCVSCSS